jgi:hypothetical protein
MQNKRLFSKIQSDQWLDLTDLALALYLETGSKDYLRAAIRRENFENIFVCACFSPFWRMSLIPILANLAPMRMRDALFDGIQQRFEGVSVGKGTSLKILAKLKKCWGLA